MKWQIIFTLKVTELNTDYLKNSFKLIMRNMSELNHYN